MKNQIKLVINFITKVCLKERNIKLGLLPDEDDVTEFLNKYHKDHPIYLDNTFQNEYKCNKVDVCIIIPVFNPPADYLEKCLMSLLEQKTEYSYRINCIDDGSNEDTAKTLDSYSDRYKDKICVIHQKNAGISNARNCGIRYSYSDYIGFVDQDDWVDEYYIERLLCAAKKNDADIVKCSHSVMQNDTCISNFLVPNLSAERPSLDVLQHFSGMVWGGVYKTELFQKIRFPEGYWYEDMISRLLLYRVGFKWSSICESLYFKRRHDNNASKVLWSGKEFKSIDQVYLVRHLLEQNKILEVPDTAYLGYILQDELGHLLAWRIRGLPRKVRRYIFYYACYIIRDYSYVINSNSENNPIYDSLLKVDFFGWSLASWNSWSSNS